MRDQGDPTTVRPGQVLGDRYRIHAQIGCGGMATVYEASDLVLDRRVAVKVPLAALAEDDVFIERFHREATAAGSLAHPNVVAIYDRDLRGGLPYLVMELVDGHTLRQILASGPLTEPEALEICGQICSALEYAHRHRYVHRDLKPENVLVTDDGSVKVTDFGLVRAVDAAAVTPGRMGSVAYMAPEQADGAPVDARADLYALGVITYEMLAGERPEHRGATRRGARPAGDVVPLADRDLDVSAGMSAFVSRAMARRATERFASAHDMRDAVHRLRHGSTVTSHVLASLVSSRPPMPVERPGRATATDQVEEHGSADRVWRANRRGMTLTAVAAAAAAAIAIMAPSGGGRTVVPDIRGLPAAVARQRVGARHLGMLVERRRANDAVPPGAVTEVSPGPGTRVAPGTVVHVNVARPDG